MKYIILLSDGMAGRPLFGTFRENDVRSGSYTSDGYTGKGFGDWNDFHGTKGNGAGSDTANLAVMKYSPKKYYTGRSPLEALSIGVDMADSDISFRCNLVTLSEEGDAYEERTILDHSSDEISTQEAEVLLSAVKERL